MPPLWVWILLAAICVSITGVLYKVWQIKSEKEFAVRMAFVQQRIREAGNKPVILMLGTSLTRSGVDSAHRLEAGIEKITGIRPVAIKVWRSATSVSTTIEAMPQLKDLAPSLLVVEANMLVTTPEGRNLLVGLENALADITRFKITVKKYAQDENKSTNERERFHLYRYRKGVPDPGTFKSFQDLAVLMQSRGTRILLVDFPLEPTDSLKKWNAVNADLINRNLNFIQKAVPVQYYAPPFNLDSNYFYDGAHLNKEGNAVFSNWLIKIMANELRHL